jgi:hypothetical protein
MSKTTNKFAPEVRARAIRMVLDHETDYPSPLRLAQEGDGGFHRREDWLFSADAA